MYIDSMVNYIRELEEQKSQIEMVSGMKLDELLDKFMQGYTLRENVPDPRKDDWKLTTCPICGAECWETEIARQALSVEPRLRAACTACALSGKH